MIVLKLYSIGVVLLKSCHAKGCDRISKCPRQCGCRSRRTFELNTETAMCWQMAEELWQLIRSRCGQHGVGPTIAQIESVTATAKAFSSITRFHMSKGWQRFFEDLWRCISDMTGEGEHCFYYHTGMDGVLDLENRLGRLKREPREDA